MRPERYRCSRKIETVVTPEWIQTLDLRISGEFIFQTFGCTEGVALESACEVEKSLATVWRKDQQWVRKLFAGEAQPDQGTQEAPYVSIADVLTQGSGGRNRYI